MVLCIIQLIRGRHCPLSSLLCNYLWVSLMRSPHLWLRGKPELNVVVSRERALHHWPDSGLVSWQGVSHQRGASFGAEGSQFERLFPNVLKVTGKRGQGGDAVLRRDNVAEP